MTARKKHHFVPKLLLRRFSVDGASIGLCNLRSGIITTRASIKHEACRDWFYGRDGKAEHALGRIEAEAGKVLLRIIQTGRPPRRYSDEHRVLATFLVIQTARTAQAAAEANEMADKVGKLLLRNALTDPELLAGLDELKIEYNEPAAEALRPAVLETPVILDLKFKLLHNATKIPFVLGDHPAIKHNGLYNSAEVSVLGLANSGIQVLLPISPKYAIVFYDEAAYTLGNPASHIVTITSDAVASALNDFQWANAFENIYFLPQDDLTFLSIDRERLEGLRRDEQVSVGEESLGFIDGRRGKIVSVQTGRPSQALRMPLFRNRVPPVRSLSVAMLPVRNAAWAAHVQRMIQALDDKLISPEDFHVRTMPSRFLREILKARTQRSRDASANPAPFGK